MADLGNLYFGLHLKDYTDKEKRQIIKKLQNLNAKMKLGIDGTGLKQAVDKVLSGKTYNIKVNPSIASNSKKMDLDVNKSTLRNSVREALKGQTFKADLRLVVRQASVQEAIKQAFARAGMAYNTTPADVRGQRVAEIQARMAQQAALAQQRLATEAARTARAQASAANASERQSRAMRNASGWANQLGNQLGTMFSIYAIERFITKLIEVGGQFEQQHIALKAMLGDVAKADTIFTQIKGLAIESPFTFIDLSGYTKQLTAFQIPYDELYDTTKRLADISAGLGVDMGRLILAYGQVRSAAFLRGQEVRQFTEAGIPLLDALAKKFGELEGQVISTGEVFDRISNREVPFEMVRDVLWDMTDAGGQFYNMQSKLVESLSGKYMKLKDSLQIMLSEIASSNSGLLGGGLDAITSMVANWEKWGVVIEGVLAAVLGYKAGVIGLNAVLKVQKMLTDLNTASLIANSLSMQRVSKATLLWKGALNSLGKANIWGIIISAVAMVGVGIYNVVTKTNEFANELKGVRDEAQKTFGDTEKELDGIYEKIHNLTKGTKEYKDVVEQLNSQYGEYIDHIDAETASYSELAVAISKAKEAAKQKAMEDARLQGKAKIDEEYGEELAGADKRLLNVLKKGYSETDANTILRIFKENIKASYNADGTYSEIASISDIAKQLGLEASTFNGHDISRALSQIIASYREYYSEIFNFNKKVEQDFGATTIFGVLIEREDEEFNKAIKSLTDKTEIYNKTIEHLGRKKKIYEDYGQLGLASSINAEIAMMQKLNTGWVKQVNDIADGLSQLSVDEKNVHKPFDYFKGVYEQYIETGEKIKNIELLPENVRNNDELNRLKTFETKAKAILDTLGIDWERAFGEEKKEKGGSQKDATADAWNTRISLIKKAGQEYEKLKEVYGPTGATEKLKGTDAFKPLGDNFNFANAEEELKKYLNTLSPSTDKQKEAVRKGWEIYVSLVFDTDKNALQARIDEMRSYIDETISQYDLYKKLFDLTGNEQFAKTAFSVTPVFDDVATALNKKLGDKATAANITLGEDVFTKTEKDAKALFGENGELFELWKTIKARIEQNGIDLKLNVAQALSDTKSIDKQIEALTAQKGKALTDYTTSGGTSGDDGYKAISTQYDTQINKLKSERETMSEGWRAMFKDVSDMGILEIGQLYDRVKSVLDMIVANGEAVKNENGEVIGYKYNENGQEKYVSKDATDALEQQKERLEKLVPLWEKVGNGFKLAFSKGVNIKALAEGLSELSSQGEQMAKSIGGAFAAMGNDEAAAKANLAGDIMGGVSDLATGIMSGNPAAILGGVLSIFTSIAQFHDNNLQKQIEESERAVKKLQNVYENLEWTIEHQLGAATRAQTEQMLANLRTQKKELEEQKRLEEEKKDTDDDAIIDLEQEIEETRQQIETFYEELANEQYGIDIKDWASQISDALVEAFANGTDAAEAFDDAVADIMRNVVKEMFALNYIEPALTRLKEYMFGDNGIFNENSELGASLSPKEAIGLNEEIVKAKDRILEGQSVWDTINEGLGGILTDYENANTVGKTIQGVTEDTANLLASYINGIRGDVSVNRLNLVKLIEESIPKMNVIAQSQLTQLNIIAENTTQNVALVEEIRDILNSNVNGINSFNIK